MENKEEKVVTKTSGGVKALLVILILALIGTSGFIVYDKFINKPDTDIPKTEEKEKKETKETVKKINDEYDYVYELSNSYYYSIPSINIDSEDAKKMNEEIKEFSNYEKRDEVYNPYYKFKYHYFTNNDVISVVLVKSGDGAGDISYKVFNINKQTGKEISNEDIIKLKGLDVEKVKTKMLETYELINSSSIEQAKNNELEGVTNEIVLSIYESNKNFFEELNIDEVQFFLNDKKELCVSFKEYQVAGPKMMYVIYNLDTKEIPNYRY